MTRSITIVNTSNWQHEDYDVEYTEPYVEGVKTASLKVGESVVLPGYGNEFVHSIKFVPVENEQPRPFYKAVIGKDGKLGRRQVTPSVRVTLE